MTSLSKLAVSPSRGVAIRSSGVRVGIDLTQFPEWPAEASFGNFLPATVAGLSGSATFHPRS